MIAYLNDSQMLLVRSETLFLNKNICHKKMTLPTNFPLHTNYANT